MRLNHVQLSVRDVVASRRFYARHFGVARSVHDEPGFTILAPEGGGLLALHQGPPPDPLAPTGHFGFEVADADAVAAAHFPLPEAGLTVSAYVNPPGGFAFARVIDPDGHHVEVYAAPAPADRPTRGGAGA
jgi:catechol 2,3-dioxygenase-like lactoylglutathione lyase family enzyme